MEFGISFFMKIVDMNVSFPIKLVLLNSDFVKLQILARNQGKV
jgi:hypothetical protein